MVWYLYIVGIVMMYCLLGISKSSLRKSAFRLLDWIAAILWPVSFIGVLVAALLMGIMGLLNERKEQDSESGSDKSD